jgi:tetratricopeptide (TPR) repeat protein
VSRLYERLDNPPTDHIATQAKIVAGYDVARMSARSLAWACLMHEQSRQLNAMEKVARRLAAAREGVDPGFGAKTLQSAADLLVSAGEFEAAGRIWEAVPADSPFQPDAAKGFAQLLLWRQADFAKAVKLLEPLVAAHPNDQSLKRDYAQALILDQQAAAGKKILESLIPQGPRDRQAALAGAMARTIEFYITEGDWPSGEQVWDKWQRQYPADFLEGYSVLLRTRLMELGRAPQSAAKVAEAFALAMPKSSYAPRLLDRASTLLERSDPAKGRALRQLLKQKYPEDPLSQ